MSLDPKTRKRIVILGGGSAGWITANAMIHSWAATNIEIVLIESPAIGTVGVGEGSTPRLKLFFDSIGVQESEWMPSRRHLCVVQNIQPSDSRVRLLLSQIDCIDDEILELSVEHRSMEQVHVCYRREMYASWIN